jgi:hypothetical protein
VLPAAAAVVLVLALGGASDNASGTPVSNHSSIPGVRYEGGPEEGSAFAQPAASRYDSGPEEGSSASATRAVRPDRRP